MKKNKTKTYRFDAGTLALIDMLSVDDKSATDVLRDAVKEKAVKHFGAEKVREALIEASQKEILDDF